MCVYMYVYIYIYIYIYIYLKYIFISKNKAWSIEDTIVEHLLIVTI